MTTPSGTITMAQVNAEIGASPTAAITLNDTAVRRLAATVTLSPTSPFLTSSTQLSMDNLRGRKATIFASGGTEIDSGGYRIHIFTSPGTFTVSYVFPTTADTVEYLVVAGGGAGGYPSNPFGPFLAGGGGGAGGYRTGTGFVVSSSPGSYPITIGAGGAADFGSPKSGSPSIFSTITSTGGGYGGFAQGPTNTVVTPASPGGSGGGSYNSSAGGSGNNPPTTPPQGNPGGVASGSNRGGGGGAGAAGSNGSPPSTGGNGGIGIQLPWSPPSYGQSPPASPTSRYFAGGGGGSGSSTGGSGGLGGGGNGANTPAFPGGAFPGTSGTVNTGGGGGGTGSVGNGGSGIVMIRYPIV